MEPSFVSANKTHRPRASGAKADKKEAYQKKKKGLDGETHKNAKVSIYFPNILNCKERIFKILTILPLYYNT